MIISHEGHINLNLTAECLFPTKYSIQIEWHLSKIEYYSPLPDKCVSLRIIIGLNKDIIMSICNDDYFDEDTPVLLINDGSKASNSLYLLQSNLKADHKVG